MNNETSTDIQFNYEIRFSGENHFDEDAIEDAIYASVTFNEGDIIIEGKTYNVFSFSGIENLCLDCENTANMYLYTTVDTNWFNTSDMNNDILPVLRAIGHSSINISSPVIMSNGSSLHVEASLVAITVNGEIILV